MLNLDQNIDPWEKLVSDVHNEIKAYASSVGMNLKQLGQKLDEVLGRKKSSQQNFNQKLTREYLRYTEVKAIAKILGYKIVWVKDDGPKL